MQRAILLAIALVAMVWVTPAATTAKHKSTKRRHTAAHSKTAASTSRSKSAKITRSLSARKHSRTKGKKTTHRTARSYQQRPTEERYKEIQEALASKGYFHGEANGDWGPDSMDALKRFQADQSLAPDGKINSLSLIALGLGPKRLTATRTDSTAHPPGTEAAPAAGTQ